MRARAPSSASEGHCRNDALPSALTAGELGTEARTKRPDITSMSVGVAIGGAALITVLISSYEFNLETLARSAPPSWTFWRRGSAHSQAFARRRGQAPIRRPQPLACRSASRWRHLFVRVGTVWELAPGRLPAGRRCSFSRTWSRAVGRDAACEQIVTHGLRTTLLIE